MILWFSFIREPRAAAASAAAAAAMWAMSSHRPPMSRQPVRACVCDSNGGAQTCGDTHSTSKQERE